MPETSCKGLFFRCRVNEYITTEPCSVNHKVSYRLLKKKSCTGCDECMQFFEDLGMINGENIILPDKPNDYTIYKAVFNLGAKAYDELYEEWEWVLEPTKGEIS